MQSKKTKKIKTATLSLREYMKGRVQKDFANKAQISEGTLTNILRGRDMALSTAKRIVEATDDQVSLQSLAEEIVLPKKNKDEDHPV